MTHPAAPEVKTPKAGIAWGRTVAIGLLVVLDMGMAHYLSRQPQVQDWAVVLAVLPMAVALLGLIRGYVGNLACCLALAAGVGLLLAALPLLEHHVRWVYFIQHVTVNVLLGLWFGLSLTRGREPLCTTFAGQLHPVMHPLLVRYTLRITQAWTAFFLSMALLSVGLFFLVPVAVWSAFANLLTLPLVMLMFVIEYGVRKRVLPPEDHLGPTSAFRAYRTRLQPDGPKSVADTNA